jgi:hypothetical protein
MRGEPDRGGLERSSGAAGDLDLAGLGLLGEGKRQGEDALVVPGLDALAVDSVAQAELPGEPALGPLGDDDGVTLGGRPRPLGLHREHVALHGDIDGGGVDAGYVDVHDDMVTRAIGVEGQARTEGLPGLLGQPVELTERVKSSQHACRLWRGQIP